MSTRGSPTAPPSELSITFRKQQHVHDSVLMIRTEMALQLSPSCNAEGLSMTPSRSLLFFVIVSVWACKKIRTILLQGSIPRMR